MIKDLLEKFISISENLGITSAFSFFNLDGEPNWEILSQEEMNVCSSFTSAKRKLEFVAGRIAGKKAFFKLTSSEIDCFEKFPSVSILNTRTGAPFIKNSNFCISISHSHGVAIASASRHTVGVDIEQINPQKIEALKRMSAEYPSADVRNLTISWTLKEALGKSLRTGIVEEFSHYRVRNFRCENEIYFCDFENFPLSGVAIANDMYAIAIVSIN